jgi:hypothetical protein
VEDLTKKISNMESVSENKATENNCSRRRIASISSRAKRSDGHQRHPLGLLHRRLDRSRSRIVAAKAANNTRVISLQHQKTGLSRKLRVQQSAADREGRLWVEDLNELFASTKKHLVVQYRNRADNVINSVVAGHRQALIEAQIAALTAKVGALEQDREKLAGYEIETEREIKKLAEIDEGHTKLHAKMKQGLDDRDKYISYLYEDIATELKKVYADVSTGYQTAFNVIDVLKSRIKTLERLVGM